ncbi:tetratricopeptide repeat protein, partial [Lysobacter xanthus]
MPRLRVSLLALLVAAAAAAPAAAQQDRGAAFDRLFEQIDGARLNPATPEEAKADIARLHALVPRGDRRRELLYQSMECFQPPEDAQAMLVYARQGLAASKAFGDVEAEARFQMCEASVLDMLGQPQTSMPLYSRGIELARRSEHPALVGDGLVLRGNVYSYLGRHAEALSDFIDAQRLYDASRQTERSEGNLQNMAVAYRRMGEFEKAREYLDRSRAIAQRHQDWPGQLVVALQTGFLMEETGRADRALVQYEEALRIARQRMTPADVASAELAIAGAQVSLGRAEQGLAALDAARAGFAAVGDTSNTGMIALVDARARAALGQTTPALASFAQAEKVLQSDGNERYLELLYPQRASLHERLGNPGAALADYKRYLALREKRLAARSEQRTLMLRQQSDASAREIENQRLRADQSLREQDREALLMARRWQRIALGLGVVLILLLGALVGRQILRTRRLGALALTDELTGVANRRRFEVRATDALAAARANERPLSVVMLDID